MRTVDFETNQIINMVHCLRAHWNCMSISVFNNNAQAHAIKHTQKTRNEKGFWGVWLGKVQNHPKFHDCVSEMPDLGQNSALPEPNQTITHNLVIPGSSSTIL